MIVKVKENASDLYWADLAKGKPERWAPSAHDWVFRRALTLIEGKELQVIDGVERGVAFTLILPLPVGRTSKSPQIALPTFLVASEGPSDGASPIVEEPANLSAWWTKQKLEVVRLLTSWVDGFMAFTRSKT